MLPKAESSSRSYLFTTVYVPSGTAEGIFRCLHPAGYRGADIWIDGRPVPEGAGVRMYPGMHRVLIDVTGAVVCPRFISADVGPMIGKWRRFKRQAAGYERAVGVYDRTGERQDPPVLLSILERHAAAWATHAIGDHGWKTETEGYESISLAMMLPFALTYQNVTGEPLAPGTGLGWVLPLAMARSCGSGGGGYGGKGAMGLNSEFLSLGLPLCEPELAPAMQWELARRIADDKQRAAISCRGLVAAYVNYADTVEPHPPREIMPTTIADHRKGAFVIRNRYRDSNDFVTHFFLQTERPRGPAWFLREAGSFRISGMDTAWAIGGGQGKREKEYEKENVVVVEPNTGHGIGKTLYFEEPESGVTIIGGDLSDFHNTPTNYNVTATRHILVDYSERAGVAALFVVVDRVTGKDRKKSWIMHTAGTNIKTDGATFTIAGKSPDTSLRGQVISPINATVAAIGSSITIDSDADVADYFVLMTVQKGDAPILNVKGSGIEAAVIVGARTISFKKGRLVLGEGGR